MNGEGAVEGRAGGRGQRRGCMANCNAAAAARPARWTMYMCFVLDSVCPSDTIVMLVVVLQPFNCPFRYSFPVSPLSF